MPRRSPPCDRFLLCLWLLVLLLMSPAASLAQSSQPGPSVSVPRLINISGVFQPADGQPPAAVEAVTLSIYAEPEGGTPLWQETQSVALDDDRPLHAAAGRDARGRDAARGVCVRRGAVAGDRSSRGRAKWRGRACGSRACRMRCGRRMRRRSGGLPGLGLPAGADRRAHVTGRAASAAARPERASRATAAVLPGTTNFLAKYVNSGDVGNSAVFETGGSGGDRHDDAARLRCTCGSPTPTAALTGLAVQNLGNTATSYSGMLFYDQNGALGQFQGFNNVTHEYRINNIAREPAGRSMGRSTS